jgi:nicotinamidase-related amidase
VTPAFIFIDLLEDFLGKPPLTDQRARIATAVTELAVIARRAGFPVIWVRQEFETDLSDAFLSMREAGTSVTIKGTVGCQLISEIETERGDYEIIKKRYSAFYNTGLSQLLGDLGCTHVVICGVNTHACVRTTAVDAFQRDFHVLLATDAIASYDEEYHRESLRYMEQSIGVAMNNRDIEAAIRAA